jgi:glutathione peroxidase
MTNVYGFRAALLDGTEVPLDAFRGKVLLIVNTASACGFTPQYQGLEALYRRYRERGFEVLAFPCNQFGKQEPGDATQIQQFCEQQYAISFPLFAKVEVNGRGAHPLFQYLKRQAPGIFGTRSIKWNFTKFLVRRDGTVVRRFGPRTTPQQLAATIESLLEH